ncbi:MAG: SAM-dependent methyltransferase [Planctomycetota bacterium]|nr:MAG: SAM-dependent methyltransferase [Planctomycetota bacterium]
MSRCGSEAVGEEADPTSGVSPVWKELGFKDMPKYTHKTDKFILYQAAVQSPDCEAEFVDRVYWNEYGTRAALFREDFCGTQLISCEWVKLRPKNVAYGVDLHKPTLAWGLKHNISRLPPRQAARVHQVRQDVRHVITPKVHLVGAFNFSYFIFKRRRDLLAYFTAVRKSLLPRGLFVCDAYGGWESQQVIKEKTRLKGFTYVWEQSAYNPINDHTMCHITFKFPNGKSIKRAFTYDWRLWTLGEIQDALIDAGFARTEVYWEDEDKNGDGNGVYRVRKKADNSPGWNAYIVAVP